jgi:hypothetical protein
MGALLDAATQDEIDYLLTAIRHSREAYRAGNTASALAWVDEIDVIFHRTEHPAIRRRALKALHNATAAGLHPAQQEIG